MGLSFGNLLGLWALLGIPAVLLIHFLQKERRQVLVSTIFLLGDLQRESRGGIRFERLRNSLPLWLQILAVLLLTWLLVEPRWLRPDSYHQVVVVLDSSASMSPFREEAIEELDRRLSRLSRASARTEWTVVETDQRRGTVYSGEELPALRDALAEWRPRSGSHEVIPVLDEAGSLLRANGSVLFLTNKQREDMPDGIHLLAVGRPLDNCGFTGLRLEESQEGLIWRALVCNYGNSPQSRQWQALFGQEETRAREIHLEPGETVVLSGRFPPDAEEGVLQMSGDAFPLDDRLPLVRPHPKPLTLWVEEHPLLRDFAPAFLRSLPHADPAPASRADLRLATRLPHQNTPSTPGIYFLAESAVPENLARGPVVPENHPLMRDLNWEGLLLQQGEAELEPQEEDVVLLWKGDRPLIVLRQVGSRRWLFCNFDLRYTNAGRLPSFVVLLHRFLEEVRENKPAFEQKNLQTGQRIAAAIHPFGAAGSTGADLLLTFRGLDGQTSDVVRDPFRARALQAPDEPGFWEIRQDEDVFLRAAVHFADPREADFSAVQSAEEGAQMASAIAEKNSTADFLRPLWLLLLGALLLAAWRATGRREE